MLDLKTREPASDQRLEALTEPQVPGPARAPLPDRFQLRDEPGALSISWRWLSVWHALALGLGVFLAVKNAGRFEGLWDNPDLLFKVTGLTFAVVEAGLIYFAACGLVNATTVTLAAGALNVEHGPLPWPGGKSWKRQDLAQLYGEQTGKERFSLNAMLRDGRRVNVIKGLTESAQVLWLEDTLEARMNIVDVAVQGEFKQR